MGVCLQGLQEAIAPTLERGLIPQFIYLNDPLLSERRLLPRAAFDAGTGMETGEDGDGNEDDEPGSFGESMYAFILLVCCE